MTETFKKDDFVQEKSQEKGEYAEGLCFDKIVWIFMISCIVGFRYGRSRFDSCAL